MGQSRYVLITGSVHADIGKGTVGATFGRALARAGERVRYVKIEPCLQGPIDAMPDTAFGEILRTPDGIALDADVARAAFFIPGFTPTRDSQRSLGSSLGGALAAWHGAQMPSPRLVDGLAGLAELDADGLAVVEVGGTAGEPEHEIVLEGLRRHGGQPALHLHVTGIVRAVDGRPTSKPAQVGMSRLAIAPDVVMVRGITADLDVLRVVLPRATRVVSLAEQPEAPEAAAWAAIEAAGLSSWAGLSLSPPFALQPSEGEVCVVGDQPAASRFNLWWRLRLWSHGRLRVRFGQPSDETLGVVLIGGPDAPAPVISAGRAVLDLHLPTARARDPMARCDWQGTLDAPSGVLAEWIDEHLNGLSASGGCGGPARPSAYAVEAFARRYLAASEASKLRDHDVLDDLVWRAMDGVAGKRILDLGCGAGRWSGRLVEAGAEVVGVEPAGPMANAAEARRLPNFTLRRVRAEDYRPDGIFDGVLASMSLDHVERLEWVLDRLAPAIVPGGWFIVTTEHPLRTAPDDGRRWVDEDGGRAARVRDYGRTGWRSLTWFGRPEPVWVFHRTLSEWVRQLRRAGLIVEAVEEPVAPDPRDAGNPRFWMLVARRTG